MLTEIIKPFGPSIVKARLPLELINEINNYVENVIKNEKLSHELDYGKNLAGNVKQEIELNIEFMQKIKWGEFLGRIVKDWADKELNKNLKDFRIKSSWVVRQFKNEYNPVHWHGGHISGVGYLKTPSTFGEHSQNKKNNSNGKLEFIHGTKQFSSPSSMIIKPEVGYHYFFPHYLMHLVYPFNGSNEERRSISFNAFIDHETFNVYGN